MTVSVALIVKNEERVLGRCLDSIKGAFDEIVIVDTGSEDATKEIARDYTDRIFDFAWCKDFAAARQYAFDQATGDWVAWLDADDVVTNADRIRPMVAGAAADIGAFHWKYITDRDPSGNIRCEFWRERCVRNDGSYRWAGRIHEVLVAQRQLGIVRNPDVVVEHRGDAEVQGLVKIRRNIEILEAEFEASGGRPSARLLFYLARDYAIAGELDMAVAFYEQCLRVSQWDEERFLAQTNLADLYRAKKRYDRALDADLQALKIYPDWPDAYFGLAETYYYLSDWNKVLHWTHLGRAMPIPDTTLFFNHLDYSYNWIIFFTNALYRTGAVKEALEWTRRALEICPDDPMHQSNERFFAGVLAEAR